MTHISGTRPDGKKFKGDPGQIVPIDRTNYGLRSVEEKGTSGKDGHGTKVQLVDLESLEEVLEINLPAGKTVDFPIPSNKIEGQTVLIQHHPAKGKHPGELR